MPIRDVDVTSPVLPGGTLVRAVFDRFLMQLSDRGGASGLIGARWADLCDEAMQGRIGETLESQFASVPRFTIERVVRLDDIPAIAAAASKRKLQNPDFLILGRHGDLPVIQAADAKFSVETARAKQVSGEVVTALGQLGSLLTGLLHIDLDAAVLVPGIFLCPDFSLTHLMLKQRVGVVRATVSHAELLLLPVEPEHFIEGLEAAELMGLMHGIDRLALSPAESLLVAVYYFRIVRACVSCWLDETGPLLAYNDPRVVDEGKVAEEAAALARRASSAYRLVHRWHQRAREVQDQRQAVERATALPLSGRELRGMVAAVSGKDSDAPSVNRVRRQLASWHRAELREQFGPLHPPVPDFDRTLRELAAASRAREAATRVQAERIVAELAAPRAPL